MSVRHALLALLCEGPKYGLQLREEFEAGTGEVWPLNIGQVYTTLRRLERGLKDDESGYDLSFALVVDAELFRLDSVVRWLDSADGRLKRAAAEPPGRVPLPLPRPRRKVVVRP